MRVIRAPLTRYAYGDEFRLYGLGDLHLGCPTGMTGTFKRGRYEDKPGDAPTSTYEARKDFFPTTQLGPPEVIITPRVNNGKEMNLPPFDLTVRV